jgi:hypothetical protein
VITRCGRGRKHGLSSRLSRALAQLSVAPKFSAVAAASVSRDGTRPVASRAADGHCSLSMIAERDIAVWIVSALLALGVGWSRYAKWRTRDKLVRELAAMDPERREKVLSHLNPRLAMEAREQLMKHFV